MTSRGLGQEELLVCGAGSVPDPTGAYCVPGVSTPATNPYSNETNYLPTATTATPGETTNLTAIQQQLTATADVVNGILSGQYTGSAPGLAKSTNTAPIYLLLALVGIVAFMGAAQ